MRFKNKIQCLNTHNRGKHTLAYMCVRRIKKQCTFDSISEIIRMFTVYEIPAGGSKIVNWSKIGVPGAPFLSSWKQNGLQIDPAEVPGAPC